MEGRSCALSQDLEHLDAAVVAVRHVEPASGDGQAGGVGEPARRRPGPADRILERSVVPEDEDEVALGVAHVDPPVPVHRDPLRTRERAALVSGRAEARHPRAAGGQPHDPEVERVHDEEGPVRRGRSGGREGELSLAFPAPPEPDDASGREGHDLVTWRIRDVDPLRARRDSGRTLQLSGTDRRARAVRRDPDDRVEDAAPARDLDGGGKGGDEPDARLRRCGRPRDVGGWGGTGPRRRAAGGREREEEGGADGAEHRESPYRPPNVRDAWTKNSLILWSNEVVPPIEYCSASDSDQKP